MSWLTQFVNSLRGQVAKEPPPPRDQQRLLRSISDLFLAKALVRARTFSQEIALISHMKVPMSVMPYVYFMVVDQEENWPSMSEALHETLVVGRDLMIESEKYPDYKKVLLPPSYKDAVIVNQILRYLAIWCRGRLASMLLGDFDLILKQHSPEIMQLHPDIFNTEFAVEFLRLAFTEQVSLHPQVYPKGDLLRRIIVYLFP